jgi:hypothetical protein
MDGVYRLFLTIRTLSAMSSNFSSGGGGPVWTCGRCNRGLDTPTLIDLAIVKAVSQCGHAGEGGRDLRVMRSGYVSFGPGEHGPILVVGADVLCVPKMDDLFLDCM